MTVIYDRLARLLRGLFDYRLSGPPVLAADNFPHAAAFVASWRALQLEANSVARALETIPRFHEIMPEQRAISANDGGDWRLFVLKAYGIEHGANMRRCPRLAALVQAAPEVLSASFSFLGPRKHIPPHRGPFRGVIRFYLPLIMPHRPDGAPACVLRIAGVEHRVDEGCGLLWDDTFEHEVRNDSDQVRAVLLLDVWRPRMPPDMRVLSAVIVGLVRFVIRIRGLNGPNRASASSSPTAYRLRLR